MRRVLGCGLALATALNAVAGRAVRADPAAPQIAPIHLSREDAQRLREQQRWLDVPGAPAVPGLGATSPDDPEEPPPPPPPRGSREMTSVRGEHIAGGLLIGLAGATALVALGYFAASATADQVNDKSPNDDGTIGLALLGVSALAGISGGILLSRQPKLQVAPIATSRSVGLAFTGRL